MFLKNTGKLQIFSSPIFARLFQFISQSNTDLWTFAETFNTAKNSFPNCFTKMLKSVIMNLRTDSNICSHKYFSAGTYNLKRNQVMLFYVKNFSVVAETIIVNLSPVTI